MSPNLAIAVAAAFGIVCMGVGYLIGYWVGYGAGLDDAKRRPGRRP